VNIHILLKEQCGRIERERPNNEEGTVPSVPSKGKTHNAPFVVSRLNSICLLIENYS
jgi:hypothetical protein